LPPTPLLAAAFAATFASLAFLAALLRTALENHSPSRLRRAARRVGPTPLLQEVLRNPEPSIRAADAAEIAFACLFVAASIVAAWTGTPLGNRLVDLVAACLATTALLVLLLEGIPQPLLHGHEERALVRVARSSFLPWAVFLRAGNALESFRRMVLKMRGLPPVESPLAAIRREIRKAVESGEREGALESEHGRMIERVLRLRDTVVSEVMTPRTEMVSVEADTPVADAVRTAMTRGVSRVPVHEGTRDLVIGIFYVKDVLRYFPSAGDGRPIPRLREILRKPTLVPEGRPIGSALRDLLAAKTHMAIVVDEFGGTAGLVTLEDLLEEIVGEIRDEYDRAAAEPPVRVAPDGSAEVLAKVPITELNRALDLDLPASEDFDTVGGFVVSTLGRVPRPGETVVRNAVEFRVLDADARRVKRIRVTVLDRPEGE
jgi:CBS domain containing-hemolysin-like protein